MKQILILILLSIVYHGVAAQTISKQTNDNFSKLKWIEGTWMRTNNKRGQSGTERWQRISPTEFFGTGTAMKEKDTVFVEKLRILIRENTIFYVSDVPENPNPVFFKLTEITAYGFVCENPKHDFPKKIEYKLKGKLLTATISGDGKSIDYLFSK